MEHTRPDFRGCDPALSAWLDDLGTRDDDDLPLLDPDILAARLERCDVDPEDRAETVGLLPRLAEAAELRWLGGRVRGVLLDALAASDPTATRPWPQLPDEYGSLGRHLPVFVYCSMLEELEEWYDCRGIDRSVLEATLADVGEKLRTYRQRRGCGGLDRQRWLWLHFTGRLFRLGRLQFERAVLPEPLVGGPAGHDGSEAGPRTGDPVLSVHISEGGSLAADACEASFDAAGPFFDRYFPQEGARFATCQSWLLDEQLAGPLPPTSNILAFQRFFRLWPGSVPGDADVATFVFHRDDGDRTGLPRRTSLQRALVEHWDAGGHWLLRRGWRDLRRS